jgi:uncharacterized protein (DUF2267 family)
MRAVAGVLQTDDGWMDDLSFIGAVAGQLGCDRRQAENIVYAVFGELRDRLTPGEAADVAAQLPTGLKHFWRAQERTDRRVERTHVGDFIARIRAWAALADDDEADRAIRVVFRELQKLLGSPSGMEGEAWDVFSQLPKDLKKLWLACAPRAQRT